MKGAIWKYPISARAEFTLEMPEGRFEFLSVQMQGPEPCMWVIVNPTQRLVPHKFRVVPTGENFERDGLTYLGTFQPMNGLVFHLFSVL